MPPRLYSTHVAVYDALYRSFKPYRAEVEFIETTFERLARTDGRDVLVIGCGPGEHARHLRAKGFEVVGLDKHEAMVRFAWRKVEGTFLVDALPDLAIQGTFDLVIAPFTVINHLAPEDLEAAIGAMLERVAEGGIAMFDIGPFPADADDLPPTTLRVHETDMGPIARLTDLHPLDDDRVRWESLVVVADRGDTLVDSHTLTAVDADRVATAVEDHGWAVERFDGYGPGNGLTVFAAH